MGEGVFNVLVFVGRSWLVVSLGGMYTYVGSVNIFGLVEMHLCNLHFC